MHRPAEAATPPGLWGRHGWGWGWGVGEVSAQQKTPRSPATDIPTCHNSYPDHCTTTALNHLIKKVQHSLTPTTRQALRTRRYYQVGLLNGFGSPATTLGKILGPQNRRGSLPVGSQGDAKPGPAPKDQCQDTDSQVQGTLQDAGLPQSRGLKMGGCPNHCAVNMVGLGEQQSESVGRDPWAMPSPEDARTNGRHKTPGSVSPTHLAAPAVRKGFKMLLRVSRSLCNQKSARTLGV